MKLSILIPVYNVEKYIRRCLDSVYNQLDVEDEVVIVDDGSKDGSGAICDEYQSKYPNQTKVFHKQNEGAYPTRNYALDRATGDYVWLIDPDDYIQEGVIIRIKSLVELNDSPDVVSLAYKRFTDTEYFDMENSYDNIKLSGHECLNKNMFNAYLWAHVYNRSFLVSNNIRFNDNINTQGDWLFNVYVHIDAHSVIASNIYAYNYYQSNPTSTLSNKDPQHRVRCVENSLVAIMEMQHIILQQRGSDIFDSLTSRLSLTLAGFLFSLYQVHFSVQYVNFQIEKLREMHLYPITCTSCNIKANRFIYVANNKHLFILLCRIHNAIKHKSI